MDQLRATYWGPCTINNPTEDDRKLLSNPPDFVKKVEGQDEVGKEGTPHIQFYVICKSQQRGSAMKKWLPRAHWEVARNKQAVIQYCTKTDTKVDGTGFAHESKVEYITPSVFPRWLANYFTEHFVSTGTTALPEAADAHWAAEWSVRHATLNGYNILHLWVQLRKVTVEFWPELCGFAEEETLDDYIARKRGAGL